MSIKKPKLFEFKSILFLCSRVQNIRAGKFCLKQDFYFENFYKFFILQLDSNLPVKMKKIILLLTILVTLNSAYGILSTQRKVSQACEKIKKLNPSENLPSDFYDVSGEEVMPGFFPHHVSIRNEYKGKNVHGCSGTLISKV